jgi:hypothetical protein
MRLVQIHDPTLGKRVRYVEGEAVYDLTSACSPAGAWRCLWGVEQVARYLPGAGGTATIALGLPLSNDRHRQACFGTAVL